jgi:hypothetical protein
VSLRAVAEGHRRCSSRWRARLRRMSVKSSAAIGLLAALFVAAGLAQPAIFGSGAAQPAILAMAAQSYPANRAPAATSAQSALSTAYHPARGPLRIDRSNPRCFSDPDGKLVYLAGAHDGWELQDYAWGDRNPGVVFDWPAFLDFLSRHNLNLIRLWSVEHTKIDDGDPDLTQPMPYARAPGHGKANDGGDKFDLDRFNPAYFERLRARVTQAQQRGIYVIVMLFQGWSIEDKGGRVNPWPYHPFHRDNNINGVDGDIDGDGQGKEVHTWLGEDHPITKRQRAYVRRVIEAVGDLDNVLYEIANESHGDSREWQERMVEYIHARERARGKAHPVGITAYGGSRARGTNPALLTGPADWISPHREPTGGHSYRDSPPPADGRKVIISDTDHLYGDQCKDYTWVWKSFCRGLNLLYMDAWTLEAGDPKREEVRRALGQTRIVAERINLREMTPHGELASSGYCLANPGSEYLVYAPARGRVKLDLSAAKGRLTAEWLDPRRGVSVNGGAVQGGAKRTLRAPFQGDAVLRVVAAK